MNVGRTVVSVGVLALASLAAGCVAVAAGAAAGAGVVYVRGASEILVEGDPELVAPAVEQTFFQLGVVVISNTPTRGGYEIIARTAKDEKVTVEIERRRSGLSRLSVREGVFGNRYFQNRVISMTTENLKAQQGEAAPLEAAPMEFAPETLPAGQ